MTLQELKNKISLITNETQLRANTAQRIGSTMQDIASFVPGYPVVTIKDNFTIDAKPNIFYNIENEQNAEIDININGEEMFVSDQTKLIMFKYDEQLDDEGFGMITLLGGKVVPDSTLEGYKYRLKLDTTIIEQELTGDGAQLVELSVYLSDDIKTGNSVNVKINITMILPDQQTMSDSLEFSANNIIVMNDDIDHLVYVTIIGYDSFPKNTPHVFREVENDNSEFSHKYEVFGILSAMLEITEVYTNVPYTEAENFYAATNEEKTEFDDLTTQAIIKVKPNMNIKGGDIANEYIFNINTPANVTFNQNILWNNDIEPDFSKNGVFTFSILNGVGCYTYVNLFK